MAGPGKGAHELAAGLEQQVDVLLAYPERELLAALKATLERRVGVLQELVDWAVPDLVYGSARALTDSRYSGVVKSFNPLCGYGFITAPEITEAFGKDLYLSSHQIGRFAVGDEVTFAILLNKGKPQAFDLAAAGGDAARGGRGPPPPPGAEGAGEGGRPFGGWGDGPGAAYAGYGKGGGKDVWCGGVGGDWTGGPEWPDKGCGKGGWGPPDWDWGVDPWGWDDGCKGWGKGGGGCDHWGPPPGIKGGRPWPDGKGPATGGGRGEGLRRSSKVEIPGVTDCRFRGIVKSCGKEYGFLLCSGLVEYFGKDDIYVHAPNLEGFQAGDAVSFAVIVNEQRKPQAVALQPAGAEAGNARKRPRTEGASTTSQTKSEVEMPGVTDRRFLGSVKSRGKDYGFLLCEELRPSFGQNDIYVHINNLAEFQVGEWTDFAVLVNDKGKPQAVDLQPVGMQDGAPL